MAFAPKRLAQFVASTQEVTYYTVPASTFTIIKNIVLANNQPSPVSVNLSVVPTGGTAGYANRIVPGISIPANSSVTFDMSTVMATGDFISASATVSSVVAVTISGVEESGNALSTGGTPGASQSGITVATSTTRPATPYLGQHIFESDTFNELTWNGFSWQKTPQSQTLGYAQVVASQSNLPAAITDLTGLTVTVTVPAGRRIRISGFATFFNSVAAANVGILHIREAGATLVDSNVGFNNTGTYGDTNFIKAEVVVTPTAGTHTYQLSAQFGGGTTNSLAASATRPAYILVEDITGDPVPVAINSTPVGQLAYAEMSADQTFASGTETALTGLSVNVVVPAGRTLKITSLVCVLSTTANQGIWTAIKEGSTVLKYVLQQEVLASNQISLTNTTVISPSAGSHTYTVAANGTGGNLTISSGSDRRSFIVVEDVTATPAAANTAPSSTLGYAEITAGQGGITTEVDITGLSVTVTVAAGRRLKLTMSGAYYNTVSTDLVAASIKEGGTALTSHQVVVGSASNNITFEKSVIITPSAGTHTYKVTAQRAFGSGAFTLNAGSAIPAYLHVEDITATSVAPVPISNGLAVVQSTNRPAVPTEGLSIYEYDTDKVQIYDGAAWVEFSRLGAWTNYTPVWTATGTAPAIGNGTLVGRYVRMGRTIVGILRFAAGSTTTFGTGNWQFSLPVAPALALGSWPVLGHCKAFQGGNGFNGLVRVYSGTSNLHVVYSATWPAGAETPMTNLAPWTWANGNDMDINFIYEALS